MKQIADGVKLNRTLTRLAHEVAERGKGTDGLVLLGIQTRGVAVAERVQSELRKTEGVCLPLGTLDVTLYRDDLLSAQGVSTKALRPELTVINFSLDGKRVLLCDDVLHTGRTVRAAISAIAGIGRPKSIQLLVLADRGGRQIPFSADYIGRNVYAEEGQKVVVRLAPTAEESGIFLEEN